MDQIEEVRQKTDIVELVSRQVALKRAGRNFKGLCPFHAEKTPSFMVNPELQIFKCFGCGEGGDCFSWLQKTEGVEFGEALRSLAGAAGVKLASYRPGQGEELREKLAEVNSQAAQAYQYLLTKHRLGKLALEYLKKRGVGGETIEKFRLGYAPGEWNFLEKYLVRKKGWGVELLARAGLVVEGRGYDRFRDRIIFPLADQRGKIVGFAGRVLPAASAEAAASQGGKYINTPETEVYHKAGLLYGFDLTRGEIKQVGWAVVVEGELDMIASWQAGVKNVVAIKGSALTERQVELLRRVCDTVVLALDADFAGDAAARRGIEIADRAGMTVKIIRHKGQGVSYKDPGEWATADPAGWKEAVSKAIGIYDFFIESAAGRHGLDAEGKRKIGRELLPVWSGIADEIVKAHYIQKLAQVLGVQEEDVRSQLAKIPNPKFPDSAKATPGKQETGRAKSRREVVEEYVVGLALRFKKVDQLTGSSVNRLIRLPFWRRVVDQLAEGTQINSLPEELRERVQNLMLVEDKVDEEDWDREWAKATAELEEADLRERIQELKNKEGGKQEVARLASRLAELTKDK